MTNKSRFKKAACVILAAFGVLYIANSCQPVNSHAVDSDIITLTGLQTAQMLGVSIEAYYLGTDMQYHRRDLSLVDTSRTFISSNLPADHPLKELEGHDVCFYYVVNPDDLYDNSGVVIDSSQSPLWLVSWNVQLDNVTHFVGGCSSIHYSRYFDYPFSSVRMYNYFTGGQYSSSVHPVDAGTTAGVANSASFTYVDNVGSIIGDSYDGDAITYYIGDSAFSSVNPYFAENSSYFYFIAPSINADYILSGSASPPDPPVTGGSGVLSGSLSGTVGDTVVNVTVDVEQEYPEYFYNAGDAPVYDDEGYAQELGPVIDEADNAYEVVEDGLEVLSEMPMLPAWNYLDSILSLVPAFKALMIAAFILALYGWKIYR